jgi:hypothetical protein
MQRLLWTAVFAVLLFAPAAGAQFGQKTLPPANLDGGITLKFNLFAGGGQTQLGPWYQYWPYQAHFQMAPPLGSSMPGPSFMTLPPSMMHQPGMMGQPAMMGQQPSWTPPAPTPLPPGQNGPTQRSSFQPVGYYYYGQAPSYWYGR